MKIKNLTPEVQKLVVREITGEKRTYDMYVVPNGTTDIEKMAIIEPKDISGIFEIEGVIVPAPVIPHEEPEAPEGEVVTPPELKISVHDDENNTPTPVEPEAGESFICDICKAEFGSARGLASHKNRAHPDN